ncbi:hypothetical protein [Shewanella mangrovisoli]|uniref:hypothetical protein n=1 Tax=Shewanella mangrovisoli TaxID=2864211 RepID=UPI001C655A81|nr:hypothetical protein [Shewanella mangrovisoli]QYK11189.1 hypothetical protein K0H60_04665 [Shewanella mangrovisoli]
MSQRTKTRNGAKTFSQMNSSMVVKIATVTTVTVGGMDAAVEPIGIYLRRVTGETVAMHITQYPIQHFCFGAKARSPETNSK